MGTIKKTTLAMITAACACTAQAQTASANIKGQVLDASSGKPVAGAKVTFAFNTGVTATTDSLGNFTLEGEVTGLGGRAGSARSGMTLDRGMVRLDLAAPSRVSVEVYALDSRRVKTLIDRDLAAGTYSIQSPVADLPAGVYTVRARMGARTAAVKVSTLGHAGVSTFGYAAPLFARLAKQSADVIDTIKVTKAGYKTYRRPISAYEGTLVAFDIKPGLPVGDLKIVSERDIPQVDWGSNVDVGVWDGYTQLKGEYKANPFEGANSWQVTFQPDQTLNGWGFITKMGQEPEDMSAWADGHMHIALKGTVKDIGINMESPSTTGNQKVLFASAYGYKPDNQWHSVKIPSPDFEIDFSQVKAYLALSVPDTLFDVETFYQIDDVYWKTTALKDSTAPKDSTVPTTP